MRVGLRAKLFGLSTLFNIHIRMTKYQMGAGSGGWNAMTFADSQAVFWAELKITQ